MLPREAQTLRSLSAPQRAELLTWLGDSPFTALEAGQLRDGLCRAYALGATGNPAAAIVHSAIVPTEPAAFGTDAASIWTLLSRIPGWDCVQVDPGVAGAIASLLEAEVGMPTRRVPMRYYGLERDPAAFPLASVRRLGPKDRELVRRSDPLFRSFFSGHGDEERTLAGGVVAGVVTSGQLVSAVTTSAWMGLHVDLGAATIPAARGSGLATAAAFLVCSELRAGGRIPVWAAGEPNPASWRIPEKLGFRYVGNREYVVVEGLRPTGHRPRDPDQIAG